MLATDNSVVEAALHKGNSSDKKSFDLMVRLRSTELAGGSRILVAHVSGKRMIAQGTDGVSRGNTQEGVCAGEALIKFCP